MLKELHGHKRSIIAAAFSPDGSKLITSDDEGAILWNTATGETLVHIEPEKAGKRSSVGCLVFAPNGSSVFGVVDGNTITEWIANSGKKIRSFAWSDTTTSAPVH